MYNFTALGRPVIQMPTDMVAVQELIWKAKPDLIIETGVAHGGSLIQSAASLALLDYCDGIEKGAIVDPLNSRRRVLGIDIDIRDHNREAILRHPMSKLIDMIQGSSIDSEIVSQVKDYAKDYHRVVVFLDSNHTHDHVLAELNAYAGLVSPGSFLVVFDTIVEDLPSDFFPDRPWEPGNSPKSALFEFLKNNQDFEIDRFVDSQLMLSVAPCGYLKRKLVGDNH